MSPIITLPLVGVHSIAMSMSVCLSVCPLAYLKHTNELHEITGLHVLPVAVARSFSNDSRIHYVLPVLWTTSCFPMIAMQRVALAITTWAPCRSMHSKFPTYLPGRLSV